MFGWPTSIPPFMVCISGTYRGRPVPASCSLFGWLGALSHAPVAVSHSPTSDGCICAERDHAFPGPMTVPPRPLGWCPPVSGSPRLRTVAITVNHVAYHEKRCVTSCVLPPSKRQSRCPSALLCPACGHRRVKRGFRPVVVWSQRSPPADGRPG